MNVSSTRLEVYAQYIMQNAQTKPKYAIESNPYLTDNYKIPSEEVLSDRLAVLPTRFRIILLVVLPVYVYLKDYY